MRLRSAISCKRFSIRCAETIAYPKVHDLHAVRPSAITREALERFGALYKIEAQIRGKPPDERLLVRQEQAAPLLDDIKRWFEATLSALSAKSDTTKAIRYALNRWPALVYYCSDGQAEIDNLIAERALRGVALGRRNFMFAGSDSGGERAAAMYSLLGSARLNGLDPEAYLHYVIERIADHPANRIDELLPWNVAASLPATAKTDLIRSPPSRSPSTPGATVQPRRLRSCKFCIACFDDF
jgi:hypothetical protein